MIIWNPIGFMMWRRNRNGNDDDGRRGGERNHDYYNPPAAAAAAAAEEEEQVVPPQLPSVSDQRTLYLVNIFIVQTSRFLNTFSSLCQEKLALVHRRILELDASLTLLEAELSSLDLVEVDTPSIHHNHQ